MARTVRARQVVGWTAGLLAGAGAGIVAAVASLATEVVMRARLPPTIPTGWSAFVAGVLGGLLYAWLSRVSGRPAAWLWIIALVVATIDSLLIIEFPLPSAPGPRIVIPIVGLVVPLRQLAALVGLGRLGTRHFPATYLLADTIVHYVTAVAVALVVPRWAKPQAR